MFHLSLYDASIANGTILLQVAAVADPVLAPSGSSFLVNSQCPNIMRISAVGTNLTRVQLTSGSLGAFAPFDINPVNVGTIMGDPARGLFLEDQPLVLAINETLNAFGVQSNAGAQRITVAVTFCDGPVRKVLGRPFSLHWTAAATLVANAFTSFAPVFDNGLPSGTFAIVGSRCISAGALYHRIIPRGGSPLRPGTFACQAQSGLAVKDDRDGGLGEFLRFTNTTPPQIEIFSRSADTTEEGYFDLMKVA
jgi:hypothetical protein